ncbi:hypothetical protein RB195_006859 [Necator americanus]|uniref:Ubiquitin-like protein 5 n=1 Tax=Necator americanus TaxID=51031 RepID=A0ABR1BUJ0_NECAM
MQLNRASCRLNSTILIVGSKRHEARTFAQAAALEAERSPSRSHLDSNRCLHRTVSERGRLRNGASPAEMIEITVNDRLGKKVRIKCNPTDTIGDLKKLIAAQTGTRYEKIVLKKWYTIYKDHITLQDYEIHEGFNFELYYQ